MNKYTIIGRIGEGAHGVVLKAYDNSTLDSRPVALKRILLKRIEDGIPIPVLREVKTLQLLKHPYVRQLILNKTLSITILTLNLFFIDCGIIGRFSSRPGFCHGI